MIYFLNVTRENKCLGFFASVRIKTQFPLERRVALFFLNHYLNESPSIDISYYGKFIVYQCIVCNEFSTFWKIIRQVIDVNKKQQWSNFFEVGVNPWKTAASMLIYGRTYPYKTTCCFISFLLVFIFNQLNKNRISLKTSYLLHNDFESFARKTPA